MSIAANEHRKGDTIEKLASTTVILHWVIAIGITGMIALGLYMDGMPRGDEKRAVVALHKSFGVLLLFLLLARLYWRSFQGLPQPVSDHAVWERRLAHLTHYTLLFATIAMPITGLLHSIGHARSVEVFGYTVIPQLLAEKNETLGAIGHYGHEYIAYSLIGVIALHVAGALKHHVMDRDGTLRRMLGARVKTDRSVA